MVEKRERRSPLVLALAGRFARARGLLDERLRGAGVFFLERDKGGAAFLLLARSKQGLTELQQALGCACACRILLDDFGKCTRCASIVLLNIGDATDPIDGHRRTRVFGIVVGDRTERGTSVVILPLCEQVHARVELRTGGRCRRRRRRSDLAGQSAEVSGWPAERLAALSLLRSSLGSGAAGGIAWQGRSTGPRSASQLLSGHRAQPILEVLLLAVELLAQLLNLVRQGFVLTGYLAQRFLEIVHALRKRLGGEVLVVLMLLASSLLFIAFAKQRRHLNAMGIGGEPL